MSSLACHISLIRLAYLTVTSPPVPIGLVVFSNYLCKFPMKKSVKGWTELKHYSAVLRKQVFPILYKPVKPESSLILAPTVANAKPWCVLKLLGIMMYSDSLIIFSTCEMLRVLNYFWSSSIFVKLGIFLCYLVVLSSLLPLLILYLIRGLRLLGVFWLILIMSLVSTFLIFLGIRGLSLSLDSRWELFFKSLEFIYKLVRFHYFLKNEW